MMDRNRQTVPRGSIAQSKSNLNQVPHGARRSDDMEAVAAARGQQRESNHLPRCRAAHAYRG